MDQNALYSFRLNDFGNLRDTMCKLFVLTSLSAQIHFDTMFKRHAKKEGKRLLT